MFKNLSTRASGRCANLKFTIVTPVYNEEASIFEFIRRISMVIEQLENEGVHSELLLVDDGSTDSTKEMLLEAVSLSDKIQFISLAANVGHQPAVWCGLESAPINNTVIVMDCDLQDPPELIPQIVKLALENDIVFTQRRSRRDSFAKKATASLYYRILKKLSDGKVIDNSGDFYALSPKARGALLAHRESVKYIRGLISSLGFKSTTLQFDRDARFAGKTHYSFSKMLKLAIAGVTGFSISPLIYVSYIAVFSAIFACIGSVVVILMKILYPSTFSPGIAAIIVVSLILGSLILTCLAILSLYIARITLEVKNRPLYIVESKGGKKT